jgi:hypothetical protein
MRRCVSLPSNTPADFFHGTQSKVAAGSTRTQGDHHGLDQRAAESRGCHQSSSCK